MSRWLWAKWLGATMIAVVLALPLSACGKRGDLEPPAGADPKFPRQYPTSK